MGVLDLMNKKNLANTGSPYTGPSTSFTEIVPAAFKYTRDNFNFDASDRLIKDQIEKNNESFKALEGKDFEPSMSPIFKAEELNKIDTSRPSGKQERDKILRSYQDAYILQKKREDPERYKDLRTFSELEEEAKKKANESLVEYQNVASRAPGFTRTAATLAGGFAASMTDPLNLATMPLGASASKSIFKAAAIEAGLNAGVELISQPKVADWQLELGQKYEMTDVVESVGMAAAFGGVATTVVKGAKPTSRAILNGISNNKTVQGVVRKAAKYLERFEHIREANPLKDAPDGLNKHIDTLKVVSEKMNKGERVLPDDLPINPRDFNSIDTRPPKGATPEIKRQYAEIEKFQDADLKLSPKQIDIRNKLIKEEIQDMALEVQEAIKVSGLTDVAGEPGKMNRFYENTFPKWYKYIGAKNKEDLAKIIEKGKGKRYERLKEIAETRLRDGYESPISGKIEPSREFLQASNSSSQKSDIIQEGVIDERRGITGQRKDEPTVSDKPEALKGAPESAKPSSKAREVARKYQESKGREFERPIEYAEIDLKRSKKIADAFESMEHNPNDPRVIKAYNAMIDETMDQYQFIKETGIKIELIKPEMKNPYPNGSKDLINDVEANNHMWVFPTEQGFGQKDIANNPLLKPVNEYVDGYQLTANDVFRVVHDYFGHVKEGLTFGPKGEENAWQSHVLMYSPDAAKAMTTETRGQNSWVNYGPLGEKNRTNPTQTVYAQQKVGLLPDWAMKEGRVKTEVIKPKGVKIEDPNFKAKELGVIPTEDRNLIAQREILQQTESEEFIRASEADFERLMELDPNKEIIVDMIEDSSGNMQPVVKTARELQEEFLENKNLVEQISNCAIGKK